VRANTHVLVVRKHQTFEQESRQSENEVKKEREREKMSESNERKKINARTYLWCDNTKQTNNNEQTTTTQKNDNKMQTRYSRHHDGVLQAVPCIRNDGSSTAADGGK
jgi:hypothetical protein